jgi:hypothetical protein
MSLSWSYPLSDAVTTEDSRVRFLKEAAIMAQFDHSNIGLKLGLLIIIDINSEPARGLCKSPEWTYADRARVHAFRLPLQLPAKVCLFLPCIINNVIMQPYDKKSARISDSGPNGNRCLCRIGVSLGGGFRGNFIIIYSIQPNFAALIS